MKKFLLLLMILILALNLSPAAAEDSAALIRYAHARIGVQTGTIQGPLIQQLLPEAELHYFNSQTDMLSALQTHKIDCFATDRALALFMMNEVDDLTCEPNLLSAEDFAPIFTRSERGRAFREQYNEFIARLEEDDTLDEMTEIWFGKDDSRRTVLDYENLPATNGVLKMGADSSIAPFAYMKDNRLIGYDIDIMARFCKAYGYRLQTEIISVDGLIAAVSSGRVDVAANALTITEERAQSVDFGHPNFRSGTVLASLRSAEISGIPQGRYATAESLNGKPIGIQTGTSFDAVAAAFLPDSPISYLNNKADLNNALMSGKIEAFLVDEPVIKAQMHENNQLTYIPQLLESYDFAYVFPKTEEGGRVCQQLNEYLSTIRANGTLAEIDNKWFSGGTGDKTIPDYSNFPAVNGTLKMATEALYEPFVYILNNEIVGYDIDIAARFCEAYGYGLEITDMNFDAILPSIVSGKCDFGGVGITITEERAKSVLFSDPNYTGGVVLAVLREDTAKTPGFWDSLSASFDKTFIREQRWKLFLEGVGTTLLITLLSALFGTILGFLVFMLCRNGNRFANLVTGACTWLIQGMPMVVLLMILYYVVFGSTSLGGVPVAIFGFTLTFGASVLSLLRMGVGAVDKGQYEAASALGYSNLRTFFRIILPQAIPHVMPSYKGEIISLIKATAIVGYIAVQDLTKMGDIVRSRTYEAFFPLIAITVIYFLLEILLAWLVRLIPADARSKKHKSLLKGVKCHD